MNSLEKLVWARRRLLHRSGRETSATLSVIARSKSDEAIQHLPQKERLDCFASLAMTAFSITLQIEIQRLAFVELDAKRVQQHRDLGVLADRKDDIHALLLVEMLRQFRPDRFGDEVLAMQVVGGTQQ